MSPDSQRLPIIEVKTGVNLPEGKNLVGAFWQPSGVVCDTNYLDTLPEKELRCGWGEVAKYHFLTGDDMLALSVEERIALCVKIKADIVAADEREGGIRALLNYGHTFGHAIETTTHHQYAHGEAVAIGLLCAAHLAHVLGRIDSARVEHHYNVMARDKKAIDGLTFILDGPKGLETVSPVAQESVVEALNRMATKS